MAGGLLFTTDFLERGIAEEADWRGLDEALLDRAEAELKAVYDDFPVAGEPGEDDTEHRLIYRLCAVLGWGDRLGKNPLSAGRRDVPDQFLFLDAAARRAAEREREDEDKFRHATVIVEAKRWNLPLDRRSGRDVPPSAQLLNYMTRAYLASDRKLRFGFLTNGRHWRLYFHEAKSPLTEFYEEDLAALLGVPGCDFDLIRRPQGEAARRHRLKCFLLFFRREAYETAARGRTFPEQAVREGRRWEDRVREDLSETVFTTVFPGLLRALKTADLAAPQPPAPAYLAELRDATFIYLYRLLFALYAEDRNLIPRPQEDDQYGLSRVRGEAERRAGAPGRLSAKRTDLYDHTLRIFETIDEGDPSVGVPPFDGGLFARDRAPLLYRARIPDRAFAPIVDALSRTPDGKRINYRDLSVRELGAIYERILEYEPVAEAGQEAGLAVRLNPFARKSSGSYYTPDELVKLIIEKTLRPLVDEKVQAFAAACEAAEARRERKEVKRERLAGADPAEAILRLRVCDPAMGSGHFLVSLVDWLAREALEATAKARAWADAIGIDDYESPALVEARLTRERIERLAKENGWALRAEFLSDDAILRRMALKRCVYGVDKNPMAVELAKVALWLHTLTAGAPLSFLDHHLRCGDSLFGERVRRAIDEVQANGGLFSVESVSNLDRAARSMEVIERLTDIDMAEARESQRNFQDVERLVGPLAGFLDTWQALKWLGYANLAVRNGRRNETAEAREAREEANAVRNAIRAALDGAFGDPVCVLAGIDAPARPEGVTEEALSLFEDGGPEQLTLINGAKSRIGDFVRFRAVLAEARALATEERFLHWEAAFPGVWRNVASAEPEGGFDAVVGNPPWDRMKMQEVEWFAARAPEIARQPRAADRRRLVDALETAGVPLAKDYAEASRRAETAMERARQGGDYPLLSAGDINLYSLFVERAQGLIKRNGIAGLLTPSGIASDLTASAFFKSVAGAKRLHHLYDFENRRGGGREAFFPDVDSRFKFCAFVAGAPGRAAEAAEYAFFLRDTPDRVSGERRFRLTAADLALVNPNTGTAPIFRTRRDAELTTAIYRRLPVLVDRSSGEERRAWPVKYATMFHMTNDSHLFWTRERLDAEGAYPVRLGHWRKGERAWLPLYEGKMVQAFDHRAANVIVNVENVHRAAQPEATSDEDKADAEFFPANQYWVEQSEVAKTPIPGSALGFKEITSPTNERSMIAAILPPAGYGNTIPVLFDAGPPPGTLALWAGCLNSFAFDYVARFKIQGQHLNWFIVEQLPVATREHHSRAFGPKTAADIVRDHVLRLSYTAWDLELFARGMGHVNPDGTVKPPFRWDEDERRHLRARLDALYFHLYGVTGEDDVRYILSTFPIVERKDREQHGCYLTAELIVWYLRALAAGDPDAVAPADALARAAQRRAAAPSSEAGG